jgi:hypothetical protein
MEIIEETELKRPKSHFNTIVSFLKSDDNETSEQVPPSPPKNPSPIFVSTIGSFTIELDHPYKYFTNFASGQILPITIPYLLREKPQTESKNWISTQKEVFTKWMSHILKITIKPENLQKNFQNCIIPSYLIEKLTGKKVPLNLLNYEPKNRTHELQNAKNFLQFMEEDCKLEFVNAIPEELVDGDLDVILDLIWSLILKFHMHRDIKDYDPQLYESFLEVELMIDWVNNCIAEHELKVVNLKTDLVDGKVLLYILQRFDDSIEIQEILALEDVRKIVSKALELAESKLNIPQIVTSENLCEKFDLCSNLTYLSFFRQLELQRLSEQSKEDLKEKGVDMKEFQKISEIVEEEETKKTIEKRNLYEPKDVYSGLKQRRRDSIQQRYLGDYLRVNTKEAIRLQLILHNATNVLFSGIVTKLTDKKEDIIWVITEKYIFEFDRGVGNILQKTFLISKLTGVGVSSFKDGIYILYLPNKNDEMYESIRKTEICDVLSKVQLSTNGKELKMTVGESIAFHPNPINFNLILSIKTIEYVTFWRSSQVNATTIEFDSDESLKILVPKDKENDNNQWEGVISDQKESIYDGNKLRNRSSITREFLGDYLALKDTRRMMEFMKKTGERKVIFVDRCKSIPFHQISDNERGIHKYPDCIILLSKEKFYKLEDSYEMKIDCCFELRHVLYIFTSTLNDNFFLVKTLTHGDFLFNSNKKTEIISMIAKYNDHDKLKIFCVNK